MKPKEAIEILIQHTKGTDPLYLPKLPEAEQLGIEALDFFIEFQRVMGNNKDARLPSETKD